ncbi:2-dehydropantoate 2-reductase [Bacillus sp. H-16]|uniref:2-dehydropantoate 2-reductase n=1 Tax=Alteribacter salitolerans TaxID=2912333 RepID=UPI0019658A0F|nr:2-dehydropantoate 2-reductase [Alteribacter salitolerans]MBM7095877.1 2-dehydropantoate 2-reductase [Alteribacter salitolerans]
MKVAVIGAGAVGMLLSAFALKAGIKVSLFTKREEQSIRLNHSGLTLIQSNQDNPETLSRGLSAKPISSWTTEGLDAVIVSVKQLHLDEVLGILSKKRIKVPVIFALNGMGHMEKAQVSIKDAPLYGSVLTHGAKRSTDYEGVIHTGKGTWKAGSWRGESETVEFLMKKLQEAGFFSSCEENIEKLMEEKLAVNAVINPLTALYQVKNGSLLDNPLFKENARAVFNEVTKVIPFKWETVERVIVNTRKNHSSMHEDIRLGRETEVDAITGYLLSLAEKRQVTMPLVSFLHHSIKGVERSYDDDR